MYHRVMRLAQGLSTEAENREVAGKWVIREGTAEETKRGEAGTLHKSSLGSWNLCQERISVLWEELEPQCRWHSPSLSQITGHQALAAVMNGDSCTNSTAS